MCYIYFYVFERYVCLFFTVGVTDNPENVVPLTAGEATAHSHPNPLCKQYYIVLLFC